MTDNEAVSLPKNLVASIMHVLAGLPAGQVARMLIALDDAMNQERKDYPHPDSHDPITPEG